MAVYIFLYVGRKQESLATPDIDIILYYIILYYIIYIILDSILYRHVIQLTDPSIVHLGGHRTCCIIVDVSQMVHTGQQGALTGTEGCLQVSRGRGPGLLGARGA